MTYQKLPSSSSSKAVSPNSAEVEAHLCQAAKRYPHLVSLHKLGRSPQRRALSAVTVSNRKVADADKQHVLVVAGQHGNEESGRMVALALLDYLVSRAGSAILRKQKVVIYPNANPDGCEADSYGNAAGDLINMDHAPGGCKTPEGRAVAGLLERLKPELYIDCHSCGHTGFGADMVLYPITRRYTEDENNLHKIAQDMVAAGEAAGLPQVTHGLAWWGADDPVKETSSTLTAYLRYKSIVLLTENCEDNSGSYPEQLRTSTGLAKLLAAIEYGQHRAPGCLYTGYPNQRVLGMNDLCLVAVGKTAVARRASRVAIWRQADRVAKLGWALPQKEREKQVHLEYRGEVIGPVGVQLRAAGRMSVRSVTLNGRKLRPGQTNGWVSFRDDCSTFVMIAMPRLKAGTYTFDVRFA